MTIELRVDRNPVALRRLIQSLSAVAGLLGALVAMMWIVAIVRYRSHGLDASDESYYLLSVRYPHAFRASATGFDSYLAPIWWASGGSIARYRVAGLLLVLGASAYAVKMILRSAGSHLKRSFVLGATACLWSLAVTTYVFWITTPGYNLLVLVVTVTVAGLTGMLALQVDEVDRTWCWSLVALGALLTVGLATKGPAFVVVGLLSLLALAAGQGWRWLFRRVWVLASGLVVGVVLFICLTGPPGGIYGRTIRGARASRMIGTHTAETLWELTSMREVYLPWFAVFSLGAGVVGLTWRRVTQPSIRLALSGGGAIVSTILLARSLPSGGASGVHAGAGWWWVRLTALALLWTTANSRRFNRHLMIGPITALMAIGAAAGSGNGVIHQVALTVGVLGLAVIIQAAVMNSSWSPSDLDQDSGPSATQAAAFLPVSLFFVLGAIASAQILTGALDQPYRLSSTLTEENVRITLNHMGSIQVNPETARYVAELQAITAQVPTEARDCLVDLSGGTPLAALALDVKPAAVPWMIGGYEGSDRLAAYLLSGAPCLRQSFVFIEAPGGDRSIRRPSWLDTTGARRLGVATYNGYLNEAQIVWLVEK